MSFTPSNGLEMDHVNDVVPRPCEGVKDVFHSFKRPGEEANNQLKDNCYYHVSIHTLRQKIIILTALDISQNNNNWEI